MGERAGEATQALYFDRLQSVNQTNHSFKPSAMYLAYDKVGGGWHLLEEAELGNLPEVDCSLCPPPPLSLRSLLFTKSEMTRGKWKEEKAEGHRP